MSKIEVGEQAKRLLLELAMLSDGDADDPLSAEEWEATCTIMGLQLAFRGDLPAPVSAECHHTMQQVALRTGLPLHFVAGHGPQMPF